MEIEKFNKAKPLIEQLDNIKELLKCWEGVKVSKTELPMPEGSIAMWAPTGVAANYQLDTSHAAVIKQLHIDGYNKKIAELTEQIQLI